MTNDTLTFYLKMKDMMSGSLAKLRQNAKKTFADVGASARVVERSNNAIGRSYDYVRGKVGQLQLALKRLRTEGSTPLPSKGGGGLLASLRGALPMMGVAGALALGGSAFSSAMGADSRARAINFTTRGRGAETIDRLEGINNTLGVDNASGLDSFKSLSGSYKAPLEDQIKLYESLQMASTTFSLSQEQSQGAILALSQMAAKGTVSMEELRGQLAERIPGAFTLAAEAMGTNEAGMVKLVESGKLLASDFLPKFEKAMRNKFGKSAMEAAKGPQAEFARFKNTLGELATTLGNVLMPPLTAMMQMFQSGVQYVKDNQEVFSALAIGLGVYATIMGTVTLATKLWTAGQWLLNEALTANPIGLVVAGIAALVAGFVLAYNKSEKFREGFHALWETSKTIFTNIGNFFKKIFSPIFDAIDYFKKGEYGKAALSVGKMAANLITMPAQIAYAAVKGDFSKGVAESYAKGQEIGRNAKPITLSGIFGGSSSGLASAFGGGGANTTGSAGSATSAVGDVVGSTVSGGPRTININGVKFAEKIEITANNMSEGMEELEEKLQNMILRILNSASATSK